MNLTKKGCVIRNYQQCLKSKMFKFENDITLLLVGCISFHTCKVQTTRWRIKFSLLVPKVMCDDKSKLQQGQSPSSLTLFQNMNCYEILQVLMVWIHNDFMLNSFKQMKPLFKNIHDVLKLFIMNLVANIYKKILWKWKSIRWRRLFSPSCESMMPIVKSETSIS
jgi:hypothetical protein